MKAIASRLCHRKRRKPYFIQILPTLVLKVEFASCHLIGLWHTITAILRRIPKFHLRTRHEHRAPRRTDVEVEKCVYQNVYF
jgi:hypothetical protein